MKLFKNAECNSELTSFSLKNTAATYHIFCACSFTQKKEQTEKNEHATTTKSFNDVFSFS